MLEGEWMPLLPPFGGAPHTQGWGTLHKPSRQRQIVLWLGSALIIFSVALAGGHTLLTHAAPSARAVPNSVPAAVHGAHQTGQVADSQAMTVTFSLQPRNKAALERFVQQSATPHSGTYHQYLSAAAFARAFGPDPAMVRQVQSFAQSKGLHIANIRSGGLFITVTGSAKQMTAAFQTRLATFRDAQGNPFFANAAALNVPNALVNGLVSVTGMDNATTRHHASTDPRKAHVTPSSKPNAVACAATVGTNALTPPQLATAYGFPSGKTGSGQSMALVEFDGYLASDISAYTSCFAPSVNVGAVVTPRLVDLTKALPAGDGAVEDELDIEVALGMAPGLSKVHVYEAPNTNQGLIDMLAAIASDDTDSTVSDSWGSCEADTGFSVAQSEEIAFLQMAAQGQGVFVAAGDDGAYDCLSDLQSSPYFHGQTVNAGDPATDPYVVAVGGTSLTLNASTASYVSEMTWNNSASGQNNGTGGGISQFWPAPTWMVNSKVAASTNSARTIPDVAADADPATGYAEYCTVGAICAGLSGWFGIGGTSAAAPLWAALAAIANQVANTRTGLITPALYSLYGADTTSASHTPGGITLGGQTYYDYAAQVNGSPISSGAVVFNDITTGSNTFPAAQGFAPGFNAITGYDDASGLGTMQAASVVNFLSGNIRFTAPRLYMAARGSDSRYWLSGYFLNNGDNVVSPDATTGSGWAPLGTQKFQAGPAIADNGITTTSLSGAGALLWISGVATDGSVWFGSWNPGTAAFGGWASVPGVSCKGAAAATYAQNIFFVSCETSTGSVVMNTYNTQTHAWSGWSTIGGGLTSPPTMATDGTNVLIFAQAPINSHDQSDWYTVYTVANGQRTVWYRFLTTCLATPALAYQGASIGTYALSCIAGDTKTMWTNSFDTSNNTLSGWINLGAPKGLGFYNATSVAVDQVDSPYVLLFTGQTTNNAAYVKLVTDNSYFGFVTDWQQASQPGIFLSNAGTDYFGV